MRSDSQEEVVKTPTSTAHRPKTPEDAGQVEPDEKLHGCEEQIWKEKDEIAAAVTEVEVGLTGWDEDETIVEEQSPKTLGKMALEIVDGIYKDISTEKVNGALKELDELKVLDSERQPAIEMISQA
jgi:hypothetical protein